MGNGTEVVMQETANLGDVYKSGETGALDNVVLKGPAASAISGSDLPAAGGAVGNDWGNAAQPMAAMPQAATGNPARDNYAVIIGVGDYPGTSSDLPGVKYDVADVKQFLNTDTLWEGTHLTTVTDSKATQKNILNSVNGLASKVDANDNILLYYSGHGYSPDGSLVPYDKSGISAQMMYDSVMKLGEKVGPGGHVTLVLDSCFSGNFVDYFKSHGGGEQYTVISAASSTETSLDVGNNGLFTHYMMDEALNGRKADLNHDNKITTGEIYSYITSSDYAAKDHMQMYDGSKGNYALG